MFRRTRTMSNEKIFSTTPVNNQTSFKEIEARRYSKLAKSSEEMFNPSRKEAKPLEVGFERTKEILGL